MKISGLQKTSLLDYPEHLSAIVFTGGCNFNCPFCQNSELLSSDTAALMEEDEFFSFLDKRAALLEGVVITGGEPCIHKDLPAFIARIKQYDLKVKLDTNGSNPRMLQMLLEQNLLDYIAMDVKNGFSHYERTAGTCISLPRIHESIRLIMNSSLPYEFRTTVVKELHELSDFHELGQLISGAKKCYLQKFRNGAFVNVANLHPFSDEKMLQAAGILSQYVQEIKIR